MEAISCLKSVGSLRTGSNDGGVLQRGVAAAAQGREQDRGVENDRVDACMGAHMSA